MIFNPPYFSQSLKSGNERKNISRHGDQLNFNELIIHSKDLMTKAGSLWVVLPVKDSTDQIIQDKLTHRNTDGSFSDDYMEFMNEFYIDF